MDRRLWSMCGACTVPSRLPLPPSPAPGRSPGQAAALLPTMTQNYVQMPFALDPQGVSAGRAPAGSREVALSGLESGKVIFSTGDILHPPQPLGMPLVC